MYTHLRGCSPTKAAFNLSSGSKIKKQAYACMGRVLHNHLNAFLLLHQKKGIEDRGCGYKNIANACLQDTCLPPSFLGLCMPLSIVLTRGSPLSAAAAIVRRLRLNLLSSAFCCWSSSRLSRRQSAATPPHNRLRRLRSSHCYCSVSLTRR